MISSRSPSTSNASMHASKAASDAITLSFNLERWEASSVPCLKRCEMSNNSLAIGVRALDNAVNSLLLLLLLGKENGCCCCCCCCGCCCCVGTPKPDGCCVECWKVESVGAVEPNNDVVVVAVVVGCVVVAVVAVATADTSSIVPLQKKKIEIKQL